MSIWLHRISHEWEISYPLLEKGFLSIGWSVFSDREFMSGVTEKGYEYLYQCFKEEFGYVSPNRFSLYRFIVEMKAGDRVVVPTGNEFGIYEVLGEAVPVSEIDFPDDLKTYDNRSVTIKDGLLNTDDRTFDIGFIIPVKTIEQNIPKNQYAGNMLSNYMQAQQTNLNISHLSESVNKAIEYFRLKKPVNIRSEMIEEFKSMVLDKIKSISNTGNLTNLLEWYCRKCGAVVPYINCDIEDKEGEADIIAIFEPLKLILYIHAKFCEQSASDWAVGIIDDYGKYRINECDDGYSRIAWLITAVKEYDIKAAEKARANDVVLINGLQFAEMLLDAGFGGMDI